MVIYQEFSLDKVKVLSGLSLNLSANLSL